MSDRSFIRWGGVFSLLLAIDALLAVVVYFFLVPAAQHQPIGDVNAYLTSLASNSGSLQLYYLLYALNPVLSLLPVVAVYYQLKNKNEAWAFFSVLLGLVGGFFWMVFAFQQLEMIRYIAAVYPTSPATANALLGAPMTLNPFNGVAGGFIAPWFLITGLLMWKQGWPRLLAVVAFIAFADLLVGFVAPLAGFANVSIITAAIAGAVGGPAFWLWTGFQLLKQSRGTA